MADISKIQIENGIYDIKDVIARNRLAILNNELCFEPGIVNIAHRGAQSDAPQNTTESFRIAIQQGFPACETDVQKTSDGVYVIMHDRDVATTTNGTGNIDSLTWSQVQALTINQGVNVDIYSNLKVPSLAQFLEICDAGNMIPFIELKETITTNDIPNILEMIKKMGFEKSCYITSFHYELLEEVRNLNPDINIIAGFYTFTQNDLNYCIANGFDASVQSITSELARSIHTNGLKFGKWTIGSQADYNNIKALQPDFLFTNSINYQYEFDSARWISKDGIRAYNDYEKIIIANQGILLRMMALDSVRYTTILNGTPNVRTGTSTQRLPITANSKITFAIPSGINFTIRCFNKNGVQLADQGWFSGTSYSNFPAGTEFGYAYFSKSDGTIITEYDKRLMQSIIQTMIIEEKTDYTTLTNNYVPIKYCKNGNIVTVIVNGNFTEQLKVNTWLNLATLPEGYRPPIDTLICPDLRDGGYNTIGGESSLAIQSTGNIRLRTSKSGGTNTQQLFGLFTYIV